MGHAEPGLHRELPPEVVELAHRCGADLSDTRADHVVLTQNGSMRTDAARRWASFRARQTIILDRVGFTWKAAAGPLGCVAITDALEDQGPRLSVVALGFLPLARIAANDALTKGELQRYLAELPLAPDAILRNAALNWTTLSPTTLRVAASHGGVHAHVDLMLGADGHVVSAFATDRPRLEGPVTVERPWTGKFGDYRTHQGRQIPFASEVAWTLGGVEVCCWRGAMTTWDMRAGT